MRKLIRLMGSLTVAAVLVALGLYVDLSATSALSVQRIIGSVGFVIAAILAVVVINYDYHKVSQPHRF